MQIFKYPFIRKVDGVCTSRSGELSAEASGAKKTKVDISKANEDHGVSRFMEPIMWLKHTFARKPVAVEKDSDTANPTSEDDVKVEIAKIAGSSGNHWF